MLTVDEQMQDTLQRISKSAVALACLNSVSFWLKLFQLAVCMLACCQDLLDRCITMHLRHQPLELATKLFNGFADFMISSGNKERMEWIQNYIGMVAILGTQIWWTWQVEASEKTSKVSATWHGKSVSRIVYQSIFDLFHTSMTCLYLFDCLLWVNLCIVFVNRSLKNLSFPASFQPSSQFLWWCNPSWASWTRLKPARMHFERWQKAIRMPWRMNWRRKTSRSRTLPKNFLADDTCLARHDRHGSLRTLTTDNFKFHLETSRISLLLCAHPSTSCSERRHHELLSPLCEVVSRTGKTYQTCCAAKKWGFYMS